MLVYFTDAKTSQSIAVNPSQVVVVFVAEEEGKTYTVINTTTGNVATETPQLDVVAQINGAF
jgi:hypothetical protein